MGLPGIHNGEEQDFPTRVVDSQTILPFSAGDETQLAVTDVPDDLVLVSALRRFENKAIVARGTHTGGNNEATVMTDSTGDFINWGVEVGDTITNVTDNNSSGVITVVTATTITVAALIGGTGQDWDTSDAYTIAKTVSHQDARSENIRKIRITTDLDVYIELDGEANSASHWIRLNSGDSINEDQIRVVSRISFINVTNPERPTLRWNVWGI